MVRLLVVALLLVALPARAAVAEDARLIARTAHTYALAEGARAPDDGLEAVHFLVGRWRGEAFGKRFEASWGAPSGGSMLGTFKLLAGEGEDEVVEFSEILLLRRIDGQLTMRVKHFDAELVAWEDKDEFTTFRLLAAEPDAVHFSGISFYRRGDHAMDAFIVMKARDGSIREAPLSYRRIDGPGTTAGGEAPPECDPAPSPRVGAVDAPWPAPREFEARGLSSSLLLSLEGRVRARITVDRTGAARDVTVSDSTARAPGVADEALSGIFDDSLIAWVERVPFDAPQAECRGDFEMSWESLRE